MEITYNDLSAIFDYEVLDQYEMDIGIIEDYMDWNELIEVVPIMSIAIYIVLNDPKPRKELLVKNLRRIKRRVMSIKYRAYKYILDYLKFDWMTLHYANNLQGRLGKYAKYFVKELDPYDINVKSKIAEINKHNLRQKGAYIDNCIKGIKDEVEIVKEFLGEIELIAKELSAQYELAQKRRKRQKEGDRPTDIDNKLKAMLDKRLRAIGVSSSKSKRLTVSAVIAIKKEILYIL